MNKEPKVERPDTRVFCVEPRRFLGTQNPREHHDGFSWCWIVLEEGNLFSKRLEREMGSVSRGVAFPKDWDGWARPFELAFDRFLILPLATESSNLLKGECKQRLRRRFSLA